MRIFLTIFLWLLLLVDAQAADRAEQRVMFVQAKQALQRGNYASFLQLSEQLKDYPLYPYLRFADLERQLEQVSEQQIEQFTHEYADTPLADRLRDDWLHSLAQQQRWSVFIKFYPSNNNVRLQCENLQALLAQGEKEKVFQAAAKFWLIGQARPPACEQLFFAWHKADGISLELLWKRVELAFANNNQRLVTQLTPWFPVTSQSQIRLWQQVRANPNLVTQANLFKPLDFRNKQILIDGIATLARKNPEHAAALWPTLQATYEFNPQEKQLAIRAIAVALAKAMHPDAMSWLLQVEPVYANQTVREWRIRDVLFHKDWEQVKHWIAQLDPNEQETSCWLYWHARALAELGQTEAAQTIYQKLANKIDYYGLLASQQLQQTYYPSTRQITADAETLKEVNDEPSVQRAYELFMLNLLPDARSEWQWTTAQMDEQQLAAAIVLAKQWRWYDRALVTANKIHMTNDLTVRFPLAFSQQVIEEAKLTGLDPAWLLAVMRQESNFMPDARSHVGASGLMQLMPQTARLLVNNLHLDTRGSFLNIDVNIKLGSHYLKDLLAHFGNKTIATAAYNLGPTRLKKYVTLYATLGEDIWTEILPWQETRDYVKQVTLNMAIYQEELRKGS